VAPGFWPKPRLPGVVDYISNGLSEEIVSPDRDEMHGLFGVASVGSFELQVLWRPENFIGQRIRLSGDDSEAAALALFGIDGR